MVVPLPFAVPWFWNDWFRTTSICLYSYVLFRQVPYLHTLYFYCYFTMKACLWFSSRKLLRWSNRKCLVCTSSNFAHLWYGCRKSSVNKADVWKYKGIKGVSFGLRGRPCEVAADLDHIPCCEATVWMRWCSSAGLKLSKQILSVCLPQGEDIGAVCRNSEPAEGSTPADRPDPHLCCPLQSAQGTAPVSIVTSQMSRQWKCARLCTEKIFGFN